MKELGFPDNPEVKEYDDWEIEFLCNKIGDYYLSNEYASSVQYLVELMDIDCEMYAIGMYENRYFIMHDFMCVYMKEPISQSMIS